MNSAYDHSIINCHVHAFDFDSAAKDGFASVRQMGAVMDACRYSAVNVMSLTSYKAEFMAQNPLCLLIKAMHPGRAYAFGSLYYPPQGLPGGKADFREQAQRLMEAGCDGMKMMEGKPDTRKRTGLPLDSPVYDEYYGWLQERQLPLLYHVGDPASFWDRDKAPAWAIENGWFYGDGTYVPRHQLFEEAEGILAKFPGLRVIFAHFHSMSGNIEDAAAFLEKWPNVCIDVTPGSSMYADFSKDTAAWRDFFIRYQDRILYGTDDEVEAPQHWEATAANIRKFLETDEQFSGFREQETKGICLPKEVLEKIYFKNFQGHAGAVSKKVNLSAAIGECRRLLEIVPDALYSEQVVFQINSVIDILKTM